MIAAIGHVSSLSCGFDATHHFGPILCNHLLEFDLNTAHVYNTRDVPRCQTARVRGRFRCDGPLSQPVRWLHALYSMSRHFHR
jgi:hypothetical protein